jgi:hydrogenase-4 membrane subunit HyfE
MMIETFNTLSPLDQKVVICYFLSGGIFVLLSYFIYSLKKIRNSIRLSSSAFVLSVGFMLLSAAGKIVKGYPENYTYVTLWVVIISTLILIWMAIEMYKWNKRKIEEQYYEN